MKDKDGKKRKKARQRFEVHSGEGRRFNFSRLKQGFIFYVLLLLALVVIVQVGYHWLGEQFLAWRLQVVTAEQGSLEQTVEVEGVVTRSEKIVRAPVHGVILELAEAGERIPVGKNLARIGVLRDPYPPEQEIEETGDSVENIAEENEPGQEEPSPEDFEEIVTVTSVKAGLLSYHIDGLENRDGPYYLAGENMAEKIPEPSVTATGDRIRAGQPLLKIVDNWKWYYSIVLPLHPGRSMAADNDAEIVFDFAPEVPVRAKLDHSEIDEEKKEVRLTYLVEKQLAGFETARLAGATLVYSRQEGLIIPAEAIFEKNRTPGVFLNQGGRVAFQPVTVVEKKGDRALVEGLAPRSLVITRHELVEEGRRLN